MITVGINENVYFAGVEVNDKRHLVISFKEAGQSGLSFIEEMEDGEVHADASSRDIRLFSITVPDKQDMSSRQKLDMVNNNIKNTKNLMVHLLACFLTKDEIKFNTWDGTGITKTTSVEEFEKKMLSQVILDKVWNNLTDTFVRLLKPLCGREDLAFRLKLRRQSKEKHFPTLPDRYLDSDPCIEPMSVPKEQSKVKFSKYEIDNGLDKGDALPPSDADPLPEDLPEGAVDNTFDPNMFEAPEEQL